MSAEIRLTRRQRPDEIFVFISAAERVRSASDRRIERAASVRIAAISGTAVHPHDAAMRRDASLAAVVPEFAASHDDVESHGPVEIGTSRHQIGEDFIRKASYGISPATVINAL